MSSFPYNWKSQYNKFLYKITYSLSFDGLHQKNTFAKGSILFIHMTESSLISSNTKFSYTFCSCCSFLSTFLYFCLSRLSYLSYSFRWSFLCYYILDSNELYFFVWYIFRDCYSISANLFIFIYCSFKSFFFYFLINFLRFFAFISLFQLTIQSSTVFLGFFISFICLKVSGCWFLRTGIFLSNDPSQILYPFSAIF